MPFGIFSFAQNFNDPVLLSVENDLPGGSELYTAYQTELKNYFVLADGTELEDLTSLDLAYMQETVRAYETYQFRDSLDNLSTLINYPDINKGFTPSESKYSKNLYLPEEIRYYDLKGDLFHTVTSRNEFSYSSPFSERDFEGVEPLENSSDRYHFAIPGFEWIIDINDLSVFRMIETEEFGLTEIYEQYEMAPDSSFHLIQRISSSPHLSPSGLCVYNVVEENIQPIEPGLALRPDHNDLGNFHAQEEGFHIFPNPAADHVNIRVNNNNNILESGSFEVTVSGLNGKIVLSNWFELQSNVDLSTASIPNGIYIMRISHGNYLQTEKLIIQK